MKKLLVLLTLFLSGSLLAADSIYKVIYQKGAHQIKRGESVRSVLKGDLLIDGDILKTGKTGLIVLGFGDGFQSRMKLSANSELKIEGEVQVKDGRKTLNKKQLYLKFGNMVLDWINKDKQKNRLRVKTPVAAMGVRGTRFFVRSSDEENALVAVYDGVVLATHKDYDVGTPLTSKEGMIFTKGGKKNKVENPSWFAKINWKLDPESENPKELAHPPALDKKLRSLFVSDLMGTDKSSSKNFASIMGQDENELRKKCEKKVSKACTDLGLILFRKHFLKDDAPARKYFKLGCSQGDSKACVWIGRLAYEFGETEKATSYMKNLCDQGNAYSCFSMWEISKKNGEEAKGDAFYKKSVSILHGIKNIDQSLADFRSACDTEDGAACLNMGILMDNLGKTMEAQGFYERSCNYGDGSGCSNVGFYYQEKGQMDNAIKYYQKACYTDEPIGCYNLACVYSKKEKSDLLFQYLKMAAFDGFRDFEHMKKDPDLAYARSLPEFKKFLSEQGAK